MVLYTEYEIIKIEAKKEEDAKKRERKEIFMVVASTGTRSKSKGYFFPSLVNFPIVFHNDQRLLFHSRGRGVQRPSHPQTSSLLIAQTRSQLSPLAATPQR